MAKMVVPESEMEVESPLQQPPPKNPPLGRQSSIYSLTLDEFQHTLCDNGKNFGSMNMDEFLTSIWNAEENDAAAGNNPAMASLPQSSKDEGVLLKQPSLPRQGSLSIPAPLCRKTVDEVWTEIQKGQNGPSQSNTPPSADRQPTFGEMTLEDFLVKAGVVRETAASQPPPMPQYGLYQNTSPPVGPSFVSRPVIGSVPAYPAMPQDSSGYAGNGKIGGGYAPTWRAANGGVVGMGMAPPPMSPVSSEAMVGQVDNSVNQFGLEMGGLRGRKRGAEGPVEKVVERRQRRMIKNRESAARSRARKQAYTVELEAELNQLKEENAHLRQALAELERKRRQQYFDEMKMKIQTKAQRAKEKLRMMKRSLSCPL